MTILRQNDCQTADKLSVVLTYRPQKAYFEDSLLSWVNQLKNSILHLSTKSKLISVRGVFDNLFMNVYYLVLQIMNSIVLMSFQETVGIALLLRSSL